MTPNVENSHFQPGKFSANKTFTDSPFDNQRRFIQNSNNPNYIFSSNFRFDNSYSKDFNPINRHLFLNNKDGNICINFFESKLGENNFLREPTEKSNHVKKINFDLGENKYLMFYTIETLMKMKMKSQNHFLMLKFIIIL